MAMEQAMSVKDIDHRADIWAMGVILFEALTGRRPLEFENLGQMYTAFLQGSVPSIREVVPDLPADFGAVVDRCLQKERDARLADLGPLIEVLGRYVDPSVQGARAGGTVVGELPSPGATTVTKAAVAQTAAATPAAGAEPAPPRGRSMLALGVGAAALLALGAGAMVLRSRPTLPPAAPEAATASVALAPASAAPTVSAVAPGASAVATVVPVGTVVPATTLSPSAPRPPASARGAGRVPGATASSEPAREAAKPSLGGVIEKPPF
jgi:serine/threonine-protein kinase